MDQIDELLTRGVDKIYPSRKALEGLLRSGKKIRLYTGIDPTGEVIHVGHTAWMWKLKAFQDLGHEVIVLIGDFTGMIGDPSGKSEARTVLTKEEVLKNAENYKQQIGKIIRFEGENAAKIKFNSEWHEKMSALDAAKMMGYLTFSQVMKRNMFKERLKSGNELYLSEFFYPYLQGYDSVAMDVDLEVGGSDQMFNMMTGRHLMKKVKNKEKLVMTLKLITDATGKKIGKTEGNAIAIAGDPNDLYGQIMSIPDETIVPVFESCTPVPMEEVEKVRISMVQGKNPLVLKKRLAWQIVSQYNDPKVADEAEAEFERVHQQGDVPTEMPEVKLERVDWDPVELVVKVGLAESKSAARRLIEQGGFKVDGEKFTDLQKFVKINNNTVLQAGKRGFVEVKTADES